MLNNGAVITLSSFGRIFKKIESRISLTVTELILLFSFY